MLKFSTKSKWCSQVTFPSWLFSCLWNWGIVYLCFSISILSILLKHRNLQGLQSEFLIAHISKGIIMAWDTLYFICSSSREIERRRIMPERVFKVQSLTVARQGQLDNRMSLLFLLPLKGALQRSLPPLAAHLSDTSICLSSSGQKEIWHAELERCSPECCFLTSLSPIHYSLWDSLSIDSLQYRLDLHHCTYVWPLNDFLLCFHNPFYNNVTVTHYNVLAMAISAPWEPEVYSTLLTHTAKWCDWAEK